MQGDARSRNGLAVQKNAETQSGPSARENVGNRSRPTVQGDARLRNLTAAQENVGSQARWGRLDRPAARENVESQAPWGREGNPGLPAARESVERQVPRELQDPKAPRGQPAPWGQGESPVRAVRQGLPAIRKTVRLHRFGAMSFSCRKMPAFPLE